MERGLNENTNGLIRQFFPKGKDLSGMTDEKIQRVMDRPGNRARKCPGIKTPNQVLVVLWSTAGVAMLLFLYLTVIPDSIAPHASVHKSKTSFRQRFSTEIRELAVRICFVPSSMEIYYVYSVNNRA